MKISAFREEKKERKIFAQLENQWNSLPERKENIMRFIMNKRGIKMDFSSKMREKIADLGVNRLFFITNSEGEPRFYEMGAEIGTLKGR